MEPAPSALASSRRLQDPCARLSREPGAEPGPPCPPGERAKGPGRAPLGFPAEQHTHPAKKGRIGSRWGCGRGSLRSLELVSKPTEAFLPACGSLGSSASEPRAPKGQKRSLGQAPGSPPSTTGSKEGGAVGAAPSQRQAQAECCETWRRRRAEGKEKTAGFEPFRRD